MNKVQANTAAIRKALEMLGTEVVAKRWPDLVVQSRQLVTSGFSGDYSIISGSYVFDRGCTTE